MTATTRRPSTRSTTQRSTVRSTTRQATTRPTTTQRSTGRRSTGQRSSPRTPRRGRRYGVSIPRRLAAISIIGALVVGLLVVRLVDLQIVGPDRFLSQGRSERERTITTTALRGTISDRNGEVLATSLPSRLIAIDPTLVRDADDQATKMAAILGIDRAKILEVLERPDTRYAVLARQVEPLLAAKVDAANFDGVHIENDLQRVSASKDLAVSVTGRMDRYATDAFGGIEKMFNEALTPRDGETTVERGQGGATIPGSEEIVRSAQRGSDITLTLDRSLQYLTEQAAARQVDAVGAKGATIIIGRPQTGEILSMGTVLAGPDGARSANFNLATQPYEPGSVMKVVTMAGAFDKGIVTPDSTLVVPDIIKMYDRRVRDHDSHKPAVMTVSDILAHSSNVGTILVAERLGQSNILDYLHRFGFGQVTSLGLPREQPGIVKKKWSGTDIMSIPIGQSITVTPLQMWAAYNTIANGGLYVPPRLISDVVDAQGHHSAPKVPAPHRVISPAAAAMTTQSLEKVIEEGTGQLLGIPGMQIAAKTGTAYKVVNGSYGTEGRHTYDASFVGFFPASNPQISIMVMVDEPQYPKHLGAVAAGPLFDEMTREVVRRYAIVGDDPATAPAASARNGKAIRAAAARPPATVPTTTVAVPATSTPSTLPTPATTTPTAKAAPAVKVARRA